ncbi:hypothetical protein HYH02_002000 [Chlamydomonas schloesseri]|uniref:BTB domain-containing protein n=1 Tax=Chlamydomonas schloesseri TaxID=2026947 RepID=A0A835WUB4_9CHLO|nr:hypothetical protein HYH02_002000 [Chlamydomonas schloesseri]|eukprot:KAG2453791.1 hypothetical protein HYH02_002000 [Chlamydomonas schloesseri]
MMHSADVELVLDEGRTTMRVHSAILSIVSTVLAGKLRDIGASEADSRASAHRQQPLQQLHLDDNPRDWEVVLPLLYPRMSVPRMSWGEARQVITIARRYDIRVLLRACEQFLDAAQLSAHPADPNYVLAWLQISEQLELGALFSKCLQFLDSYLVPRAAGCCDYCGARSGHSASAAGSASSNSDHGARSACSCVCANCNSNTPRRDCRCGRDVACVLPAYSDSWAAAGHGAAYGHASATAAAYIAPATASGSGSRSTRAYPGMAAPLAAAYDATARARAGAVTSGARHDLELLYRRDGGAAAGPAAAAAPGAALRIQVHARTASALVHRYASPLPSRVHISVGSSGHCGSSAGGGGTGRSSTLASPLVGGSASYVRPLVPQPAPQPPRVLEMVKGDREGLLKLSVPTLVELLGML